MPCTRAMRARLQPLQNIMPLFRGGSRGMRTDSPWEVAIVYRLVRRIYKRERDREREQRKKKKLGVLEKIPGGMNLSPLRFYIGPLRGFIASARAPSTRGGNEREKRRREETCVLFLYTLRDKIFHRTVNVGSSHICAQELSRWGGFGRSRDRHSVLIDATRKLSFSHAILNHL